uniref:Uncharacterized protein n=1 Tax=Salmo trutta TaxID=8032 RepID=A0A674BFJ3_SALTR
MEAGPLESRLSMEDYEKLQSLFLVSVSFSRAEFIEQAWSAVRRGSREEYGLLFDSVVVTQEQRIDWERLTSFLLLGLSEKEENERAATVPRWQPPRTLTPPHPFNVILHWWLCIHYLLTSLCKGGTLGVWAGEDFALLQTHRLHNDSVRPKDLWVTAMVVLHNVHKIAVSFTSKELCFYDLLSKQQFSCQYKLQGLRYAPLSLDYWFHPTYPAQAVLTMGDTGGQVRGEGGRQGDKGGGEMGTGGKGGGETGTGERGGGETVGQVGERWEQVIEELSEHSLAIEKGCHRQTWHSREDSLCEHCPQNEVETELHFLTSCQMYDHIRDTYFPQITQILKEFENKPNFNELPYLLGEIPQCTITAARFVTCCHKKRATSEEQTPLQIQPIFMFICFTICT